MTYLEQFRSRVLQDALSEALPSYWTRRAAQWREALPREGDFLGESTEQDRTRRETQVRAMIEECGERATRREGLSPEWWAALMKELVE